MRPLLYLPRFLFDADSEINTVLLIFRETDDVVRMKCSHGIPLCNATCSPSQDFPVLCTNKRMTLSHTSNDVQPVLFPAMPAHTIEGCCPGTPQGTVVPMAIAIVACVSLHVILHISF